MRAIAEYASAESAKPIGVFDSGIGGLSVLRALRAELPLEHFVYLADSGHAPYGERSDAYITRRAVTIAQHLIAQHHIKALVVACNTATAAAIHVLRQRFADLPIVGIEPALKPAIATSHTKRIGVMATRGTLASDKFQTLQKALQGQAHFVVQACDGLARAIEHNDTPKIIAACAMYTSAMGQFGSQRGEIDTLVLGCTHYPFAADHLRALLGSNVTLLESGAPVARQTRRLLTERGTLATAALGLEAPPTRFETTGDADILHQAATRWLGAEPSLPAVWPIPLPSAPDFASDMP